MAAAVARHAGARNVVVTDVARTAAGPGPPAGADLAIDVSTTRVAEAQRELGMREGFDIGLEMSGHPTALPDMIANMNHGGRIAMLGPAHRPIAIDWGRVVTHMITIKGIYGREMYDTWYAMSAMLSSDPVLHAASPRSSPTASRPSSGRRPSTCRAPASAARSSSTGLMSRAIQADPASTSQELTRCTTNVKDDS